MEWKPIKLQNVQIKPIYEISENGDVRKSTTGRILTGKERIMLSLADGSYKHFFRKELKITTFGHDEGWRLIKLPDYQIKPIYEISRDGDIRRLKTTRLLAGRGRVMLTLADGSQRHFLRSDLLQVVYPEDYETQLDDIMLTQVERLKNVLRREFPKHQFTFTKSDTSSNMVIVNSERFNPFSIKRETNGKVDIYVIRQGANYDNPKYYGNPNRQNPYTYKEVSEEELEWMVCHIVYRRIYEHPKHLYVMKEALV